MATLRLGEDDGARQRSGAAALMLLGLPDRILTKVLTNTICPGYADLSPIRSDTYPDFGDWTLLFTWRRTSRRFCELIKGFLVTPAAAHILVAAIRASLYSAIRLQHSKCTQEYTLDLRTRLLKIANETSSATEAKAREELCEVASKLTNSPSLQKWLLSVARDLRDYTYVRAQTRAAAWAIDDMNTPRSNARVERFSNWVMQSMVRKITASETSPARGIIEWATVATAQEIPYPLQRYCNHWLRRATSAQRPLSAETEKWASGGVSLHNIRSQMCASPDCIFGLARCPPPS